MPSSARATDEAKMQSVAVRLFNFIIPGIQMLGMEVSLLLLKFVLLTGEDRSHHRLQQEGWTLISSSLLRTYVGREGWPKNQP